MRRSRAGRILRKAANDVRAGETLADSIAATGTPLHPDLRAALEIGRKIGTGGTGAIYSGRKIGTTKITTGAIYSARKPGTPRRLRFTLRYRAIAFAPMVNQRKRRPEAAESWAGCKRVIQSWPRAGVVALVQELYRLSHDNRRFLHARLPPGGENRDSSELFDAETIQSCPGIFLPVSSSPVSSSDNRHAASAA
jgi:hypothetical protein